MIILRAGAREKKVAIGCRTGVKTHVSAIVENSIYSFKSRKVIETPSWKIDESEVCEKLYEMLKKESPIYWLWGGETERLNLLMDF